MVIIDNRSAFLTNCFYFGEGFWDVLLETAELIVLEDHRQTVLNEDDPFEQRFHVQLLQDFLFALVEEAHLRPLQILPQCFHCRVKMILEELTEVHLRLH